MIKKVLTIGGAMQDLFIRYKNPPETIQLQRSEGMQKFIVLPEGRKVEIQAINKSVGGGATNAAVSFKRLGLSVSTLFKIGSDEAGAIITDTLHSMDINIDNIMRTDQAPTGMSIILPTPSGDRTCLIYRGANLTLTQDELPLSIISNHPHLYITSLNGQAATLLPIIVKHAKKSKAFIAVNPGTQQLTDTVESLIESLPYIDILILNFFESTLLMRALAINSSPTDTPQQKLPSSNDTDLLNTLRAYFKKIVTYGPRIAVITHGKKGVYVTDGNNIYFHPSIAVPVASTLGAGDAFGSAFVAQLIYGNAIKYALQAGIINSSSVLQYEDTQKGLLLAQELAIEQKKLNEKTVEVFDL